MSDSTATLLSDLSDQELATTILSSLRLWQKKAMASEVGANRIAEDGGHSPDMGSTVAFITSAIDVFADRLKVVAPPVEKPPVTVFLNIRGGALQGVASSDPFIQIILHDTDNLRHEGIESERQEEIFKQVSAGLTWIGIDESKAFVEDDNKVGEAPGSRL